MDSSLTSLPLPSLSLLTGTIRPNTAAELYKKAYKDQEQASSQRCLTTPGGTQYILDYERLNRRSHDVASVKQAAARHVTTIDKAQGAPQQQVLSPAQRTVLHQEVTQRLNQLASHLKATKQRPLSSELLQVHQDASSSEQAIPRPSSVASVRSRRDHARNAHGLGSSWAGTLSSLATRASAMDQQAYSRLSTPTGGRSSQPLRQSTPDLRSLMGEGSRYLGKNLRPTSVRDSAAGSFCSSESHTQAAAPNGLLSHMARMDPRAAAMASDPQALSRAQTAPAHAHRVQHTYQPPRQQQPQQQQQHPQQRRQPSFQQLSCTTKSSQPVCGPYVPSKPSRGAMYSVFQDLDRFGEGRITFSTFEEAALLVGMRQHQIKRFFSMIDKRGRGYVDVRDWGQTDVEMPLSDFTRLFIQKTRAHDGRYKDATEIDNLYAALQMALHSLQLKNSGRSVSHERLLQAFQFIDLDNSGALDKREVLDAFNGMGIYMKPKVLEEAMKVFDRDGNGSIDYSEFIQTLFPNLSRGYRMDG